MSEHADNVAKIRHSAEHILTMAMELLYGPDKIVMAMGPATDTGFYFDFEPRNITINENNFAEIEAKMQELVGQNLLFERIEVEPSLARTIFANNDYKQEWIAKAEENKEPVSLYLTGKEEDLAAAKALVEQGKRPILSELLVFVDLCKGPHVENTREIKAFTLLNVAGAYWHGDENNIMLTRIYGTAFPSRKEQRAYLQMLEEARKRDHRKLGKELDLFTFSELVGPGLPLWAPKGAMLRNLLDEFVWKLRQQYGYQRVEIPHVTKKDLYERSGHWDKFADELFRIQTREGHEFAMKPMNCPHHTQIFDRRPHSYREMPQRYANTTMVYRDEQTGELAGLSRVRSIAQDDAHVFCRPSQVKEEINHIWDIVHEFYGAFGFELSVRLSLHDPEHPEKYLGSPENWEFAENQMRQLIQDHGVEFVEAPGEAAFYGPKIDFMGHDAIGREWQVATIQLDMNMPERFDLNCINEDGEQERVVMIHAAIMGAIERFLSVLIEHYAGAFPAWLAPIQAVIIPITADQSEYANALAKELASHGLRIEVRDEAETMQNRIRKAEQEKVPYMLVVGAQEQAAHQESGTYVSAVRSHGKKSHGTLSALELVERVKTDTPQIMRA